MSVIAQSELEKLLKEGVIKVEPFSFDQIGPGSIDLHLGNEFTVFRKVREVFHVTDETDYRTISETIRVNDFFVLMPGESALAKTVEKITLPDDICGRLEGRSRFSRLGLLVHITASFMHPGISNHQVLEMYNASPIPLAVHPGTKICQFVFERTIGRGHYSGKFVNQ
ncbi:MAG: dCTP deaminase [Candidatus Aureabacteria bacterium]|nr:dCTP deaminase [Candidatus Auribacterota bacterium]